MHQTSACGVTLKGVSGLRRTFMLTRAAVSASCHALQVFIAWGNNSTAHGNCISRKGRDPKEFVELLRRRYARVEIIGEYKTSQVLGVQASLKTLQAADGERPHAVRVCIHCPTVWTRDINAARNMLRLLKCLAADEDLPGALRRPARRGKGEAIPELDILQAVADGLAEAAAVEDAAEDW